MDSYSFNCQGSFENFQASTHEHDDDRPEFNNFGHYFNDLECYMQHIPKLFNIARQKWARMEFRCFKSFRPTLEEGPTEDQNWWIFRKEIIHFLRNLKLLLNELYSQESAFNMQILKQSLKDFYDSLGSLSKLHRNRVFIFCSTPDYKNKLWYDFWHLNLEVRCMILAIISKIEACKDTVHPLQPSNKTLKDIIWDATATAFINFSNLNVDLNDYETTTPFTCPCLKKYWMFIILLFESRIEKRQSDNFWLLLRDIFRAVNAKELEFFQNVYPKFRDVNELGFCWWFLLHVSILLQSEVEGEFYRTVLNCNNLKQVKFSSNHYELNSLLKLTIDSKIGGYSELHMRSYLRCCVKLVKMWEPLVDASSLLWNYFEKRLCESFILSGEIPMYLADSNSGLLFKAAMKIIIDQTNEASNTLNSFQLFLKILSHFLNNVWSKDLGKEQIRNIIKFQPHLIQTVNTVGLYNCCSLILILGLSGDLDMAINLLTGSLSKYFPYSLDAGKNAILWKCYFGLILICLERNVQIVPLTEKMVDNIADFQREFTDSSKILSLGHWATDLLTVYFTSLQDLFKINSNLQLYILLIEQEFILEMDFVQLLCRRTQSIGQLSLETVDVALNKFQEYHKNDIILMLLERFLPWVKKLAESDTLICTVSRIALKLVILRQYISSLDIDNSNSLVNYFCSNHSLNPKFCCQFIVDLLNEPSLQLMFENELIDIQSKIIREWFYLIFLSDSTSEFQKFSKTLLNLSEIKLLANDANVLIKDCHDCHENYCLNLILEIFASYIKKYNANSGHIRSKIIGYLSEIPKTISTVLNNNSKVEVMRMYDILGKIFQKISPLIYVKSNSKCLFNECVILLLLPTAFYNTNFIIPETVLAGLKDNLSFFIEGICNLDFVNNMYINRTLRDIFKLYLCRFSECFNTPLKKHPLFISFLNVQNNCSHQSEFMNLIVETIRDSYLNTANQGVYSKLDMAVKFITEILAHSTLADRSSPCAVILTALLKLMLITDLKYVPLKDLVKSLVDGYIETNNSADSLYQSLTIIINEWFEKYQTIPENLFRMLESLSTLYLQVVNKLHPLLADKISLREQRFSGTDEILRRRYKEFSFLLDAFTNDQGQI